MNGLKVPRKILTSDLIHVTRPTGRDLDAMLHVNPELETRALAVHPVLRTLGPDLTDSFDTLGGEAGLTGWLAITRITRASFLSVKQLEYIEAGDFDAASAAVRRGWRPRSRIGVEWCC